jgi:type VI secretion system protein ImpC
MDFNFTFGRSGGGGRRRNDEERPMRLLLLGNFAGDGERQPLANRPTLRVDVDTLNDVIRRVKPRLALPSGAIEFRTIDDFHPDALHARLEVFKSMREARVAPVPGHEDIARLLGKPAPSRPTASPSTGGLDALIRNIVAPHIVKDEAPRASYVAAVDTATGDAMRQVLHAPEFQSLEAAWRGVQWLIAHLELDESLQLHLLDVTREELSSDVNPADGDLSQTGLYSVLVDRTRNVPGAQPWSLIVALFDVGTVDEDIKSVAALGAIAAQAGGVLLAGADASLAGADHKRLAAWHALRTSDIAQSIGLAAPRVLLRLPYGKGSDPIDAFAFEEIPGSPAHGQFLWGSASLAPALVVGRAFASQGWDMEPDSEREIGEMPHYVFTRDGEREMQACAERFMNEREMDKLLAAGIMPIASRRDRNAVVVIRIQSIADPPAGLAW